MSSLLYLSWRIRSQLVPAVLDVHPESFEIWITMAIIRKLESLGGDEATKPRDDDNVTIGYQIFDYAPQEHGRDCRGKP